MSIQHSAAEQLRTMCAWCGKLIREGQYPTSHGVCPECKDRFFEKKEKHKRYVIKC